MNLSDAWLAQTGHWQCVFAMLVFAIAFFWLFLEVVKQETCGLCEYLKKIFTKKEK
jgi:hypothetical protein